jgi:L-fucose isomerase-like protein
MTNATPVASLFLGAEARADLLSSLAPDLAAAGHRCADEAALDSERPTLLILTGGTESDALARVAGVDAAAPVTLLAHGTHNSLPACLEILARLQQTGRSGEIVFLGEAAAPPASAGQATGPIAPGDCLRGRRLGVIGAPSDWLVASMPDAAAVARTWGVELVDVPLSEIMDGLPDVPMDLVEPLVADLSGGADAVVEPTAADLRHAAAVLVTLREAAARHRLDACTVRCFDLVTRLRTTGCFALSQLNDDGLMAGCEGDIPATLTMMWLHAVTGQTPFMANPQQVDTAGRRLWISHCTIGRSLLAGYRVRSHFESGLGVGLEGRLEPGPVTLARIGGADLDRAFVAEGEIIAGGRSPERCRTQLELRLDTDPGELLRRPLGNHHVMVPGRWARRLAG